MIDAIVMGILVFVLLALGCVATIKDLRELGANRPRREPRGFDVVVRDDDEQSSPEGRE